MDLQLYAKHAKPEKLSGHELAFMRAQANHFIKQGDAIKVQVGMTMLMLLNHIDQMTLEAIGK
jgi:hypothetical protein